MGELPSSTTNRSRLLDSQIAIDASVTIASGRPRRRVATVAGLIAIGIVGFIVVLSTRPPASQRIADSPLLGKVAPPLKATTIDGAQIDLVDYRGQWVLVNYFATWCVPCRKEHPDLVAFAQRHAALQDLSVIGVVYSDTAKAVRDFRRNNGGTWPLAEDPTGRIALAWAVRGVPESFLVDPDGLVRARVLGGVTDSGLERLFRDVSRVAAR